MFSGVGGIFHCTTLTHKNRGNPNKNNGNGKQPQQPELINIPTVGGENWREARGERSDSCLWLRDACSMKYVAGGQPQLEVKEGGVAAGAYRAVKWLHSSRFNGSATQHKALPAPMGHSPIHHHHYHFACKLSTL